MTPRISSDNKKNLFTIQEIVYNRLLRFSNSTMSETQIRLIATDYYLEKLNINDEIDVFTLYYSIASLLRRQNRIFFVKRREAGFRCEMRPSR